MVKATRTKALPALRVDVVGRHQQAGRDRQASGAEAERHRIDVRDIDAGELGAELLLGHRADRLAGVGPSHDQPQAERHDDDDAESDDAGNREKCRADLHDVEGVGQVDGARVRAKGVEQRVLDDHREPERHQQDVAVLAVRGRSDDEALQHVAQAEKQRRER